MEHVNKVNEWKAVKLAAKWIAFEMISERASLAIDFTLFNQEPFFSRTEQFWIESLIKRLFYSIFDIRLFLFASEAIWMLSVVEVSKSDRMFLMLVICTPTCWALVVSIWRDFSHAHLQCLLKSTWMMLGTFDPSC